VSASHLPDNWLLLTVPRDKGTVVSLGAHVYKGLRQVTAGTTHCVPGCLCLDCKCPCLNVCVVCCALCCVSLVVAVLPACCVGACVMCCGVVRANYGCGCCG